MAVGLGAAGQYLPPVFNWVGLFPPQTIISLPVQTAVWLARPAGALVVVVAVQVSLAGLYLPPVFRLWPSSPPTQSFHCQSTLPCDRLAQ